MQYLCSFTHFVLLIQLLLLFPIGVTAGENSKLKAFGENADHFDVGSENDERKPSMFKVGDEWLALPEVFSNLDFNAPNKPASEEDVEGQMRLRSTRFWGRIYLDGWPQTIQFFRAHFGIEPPYGRKRFVFPEPRDACSDLQNADKITQDMVLLVHRGNCTFGTKARYAHNTKASSVLIINNEPGLEHLPGPDAHDIDFSIVSIPQQEGQLLEAVYDDGPFGADGFGRVIEGYMIPINCENSGARCQPATYEERTFVKGLNEGGTLTVIPGETSTSLAEADLPLEYLLAHFGTKVPDSSTHMELALSKPVEACTTIENDVKGKLVLVRRGGCPFVKKAEHIQAAGASAIIVGGLAPYLVRMGVEPRWKGLATAIPVVMVSKRVYGILVAESYSGSKISFSEEYAVNATVWEGLEKYYNGEGWPRSEQYITKKYNEEIEMNDAFPDRRKTLEEAFEKVSPKKEGVKGEL